MCIHELELLGGEECRCSTLLDDDFLLLVPNKPDWMAWNSVYFILVDSLDQNSEYSWNGLFLIHDVWGFSLTRHKGWGPKYLGLENHFQDGPFTHTCGTLLGTPGWLCEGTMASLVSDLLMVSLCLANKGGASCSFKTGLGSHLASLPSYSIAWSGHKPSQLQREEIEPHLLMGGVSKDLQLYVKTTITTVFSRARCTSL